MARVVNRPQPGVDANVRLRADALAVAQELVSAEAVGLDAAPGQFRPRRALVLRPYAVLPVVARDEIPARIAQDRDVQPLDRLQDVQPDAFFVRERTAFFVNAAVDHAPQVLGEVAEQMRMHFADRAIDVDLDASLRLLAVSDIRRIGEGSKNGKEDKKNKKSNLPLFIPFPFLLSFSLQTIPSLQSVLPPKAATEFSRGFQPTVSASDFPRRVNDD